MCGWSWAWVAAICLRRLGFVIFQTGNPNACSYGTQIRYEICRAESRSGLAHTIPFFHMRMDAGAQGNFSSGSYVWRNLDRTTESWVGPSGCAGLSCLNTAPYTLLAADVGLFFYWEVADRSMASSALTHLSGTYWKCGDIVYLFLFPVHL